MANPLDALRGLQPGMDSGMDPMAPPEPQFDQSNWMPYELQGQGLQGDQTVQAGRQILQHALNALQGLLGPPDHPDPIESLQLPMSMPEGGMGQGF